MKDHPVDLGPNVPPDRVLATRLRPAGLRPVLVPEAVRQDHAHRRRCGGPTGCTSTSPGRAAADRRVGRPARPGHPPGQVDDRAAGPDRPVPDSPDVLVRQSNSGDTGGLLLDDWKTWDEEKYAVVKKALWQYQDKFVGLDHQVRLGGAGSTTSITLAERYAAGGDDTDKTPPGAPGKPTASDITATSVNLTWPRRPTTWVSRRTTCSRRPVPERPACGQRLRPEVHGVRSDRRHHLHVHDPSQDAAGNLSAASPGVTIKTSAGGTNSAAPPSTSSPSPGPVDSGRAGGDQHEYLHHQWLKVSWVASADSSIDQLWNGC